MLSSTRDQLVERLRHWLAFIGLRRVVGAVVSTIIVAIVGWWLLRSPAPAIETQIARVDTSTTTSLSVDAASQSSLQVVPEFVTVHVAGAVKKPGVYSLSADARVVDAVDAAGGATTQADLDAINLAHPIFDSDQVFIPKRGQTVPSQSSTQTRTPSSRNTPPKDAQSTPQNTLVNINVANAKELESLPGVGPATAQAIITYRTTVSPFAIPEDIMKVSGIGPAKFDVMRAFIRVS
jgi:competence protein ComEA